MSVRRGLRARDSVPWILHRPALACSERASAVVVCVAQPGYPVSRGAARLVACTGPSGVACASRGRGQTGPKRELICAPVPLGAGWATTRVDRIQTCRATMRKKTPTQRDPGLSTRPRVSIPSPAVASGPTQRVDETPRPSRWPRWSRSRVEARTLRQGPAVATIARQSGLGVLEFWKPSTVPTVSQGRASNREGRI